MGERLTTGEICTRSVIVTFRLTPLVEAAHLMRKHHVGCVVVVDEVGDKKTAIGILTDRDIVTEVIAEDLAPSALLVEDVMTTNLVTVRQEDSLIDLVRTMRHRGVRRIPVVAADDALVGIVSLDDVLDILVEELGLLVAAIDKGDKRERLIRS